MDEVEKEKYKNSKYISTKYKDYLHHDGGGEKIKKNKSKNQNQKKIKDLYQEISNDLKENESLLKKMETEEKNKFNRNNKYKKYNKNKIDDNKEEEDKSRDLSVDKIRKRDVNILKKYYDEVNMNLNASSNNLDNLDDSLIKRGFFVGGKNRKKNYNNNENENVNEEESKDNSNNKDNINQILEKYKKMKERETIEQKDNRNNKNKNNFRYNQKMNNKKKNFNSLSNNNLNSNNYDYIIKIRGNTQDLFGNTNSFYLDNKQKFLNLNNRKYPNNIDINNKIKNNNNYNKKTNNNMNDNDYDQEYEDLIHPKKNNDNDYNQNQLNTSEYSNSNSIYNILNNLDYQNNIINTNVNNNNYNYVDYNNYYGYDDLINSLNEPQVNRIKKKRIIRKNDINKKEYKNNDTKESFLNSHNIVDEKSYYLAPMKGIPITNISFRARMKYYSNLKEKNLEKLLKAKKEAEKEIYTFQPKTGDNKLNVIKYNKIYRIKNDNNNYGNRNRKVDYDRINSLYLDYKDRKNKIDELTKDYYEQAGISFTPNISDKNIEIKKFKNKIGQIPYLDRFDIYNANKQLQQGLPYKSERNLQFYQNTLI